MTCTLMYSVKCIIKMQHSNILLYNNFVNCTTNFPSLSPVNYVYRPLLYVPQPPYCCQSPYPRPIMDQHAKKAHSSMCFQCVDKFNSERFSLKLHFRLIGNVCQSRRAETQEDANKTLKERKLNGSRPATMLT